jgi:hypothetical protein
MPCHAATHAGVVRTMPAIRLDQEGPAALAEDDNAGKRHHI